MKSKILLGVYGLALTIMFLFAVPYNLYYNSTSGKSTLIRQERFSLFDNQNHYYTVDIPSVNGSVARKDKRLLAKSIDYNLLGLQVLFLSVPTGIIFILLKASEKKKRD